jgi:hypothetical protein
MEVAYDGQNKHGESRSCFFCVKYKQNCTFFRLERSPDHPPEYERLYTTQFVVCPECWAKGPGHLARHLSHWIKQQELIEELARMGGKR